MIVIWQDSLMWGGVDVLTARLSEFLTERGLSHRVIQASGTRLWDELAANIRCAPDKAQELSQITDTVLLPSITKLRNPRLIASQFPNARVMVWVVHPLDVITALFPFASKLLRLSGLRSARVLPWFLPGHYQLIEATLGRLLETDGLLFMDSATKRQFDYTFPSLATVGASLLPIPSPAARSVISRPDSSRVLRIGYLGRMDAMKWSALGPFIAHNLTQIARDQPISLLAITEGDRTNHLVNACRRHGIRLDLRGVMSNAEARKLLCSETDVVVAMGTSALDIASMAHPVVVIDPAFRRGTRPQNSFRFIHEQEGYCLGEFRDFEGYVRGLRSFSECVDLLGSKSLRSKAAEYVRTHHDPETIFTTLLGKLSQTNALFSKLRTDMASIDQSFRRLSPRYSISQLFYKFTNAAENR